MRIQQFVRQSPSRACDNAGRSADLSEAYRTGISGAMCANALTEDLLWCLTDVC